MSVATQAAQPLALSTSWNGGRLNHMAEAVLDEASRLGFHRLEAYCHFDLDQLRDLARQAAARGMEVATLHAPCPVPTDANGGRMHWPDPLASTQERERQFAEDTLKRTVDAAVEIGARAIVIHLGQSGVASRQHVVMDALQRFGRGSDAHRRAVEEALREREARIGPALNAAIRSITAIGQHAVGTGVRLGVEVRDGYQEVPSLDEMETVLSACEGLPVGYWHDAGHGAKLAYAGYIPDHEEYLRRFGDRLVGMHVHDTLGTRDHLAPGLGETDFNMLARYLRPETFRTLELHAVVTPEQIGYGVEEVLRPLGAFGVAEGVIYEV